MKNFANIFFILAKNLRNIYRGKKFNLSCGATLFIESEYTLFPADLLFFLIVTVLTMAFLCIGMSYNKGYECVFFYSGSKSYFIISNPFHV